MFTITLTFEHNHEFSGLAAVDQRKRLGLASGSSLVLTVSTAQRGAKEPRCEVSEEFARAYFGQTQTNSTATVTPDMLCVGDVRMCVDGNDYAATFADLTAERIQQLYVAARFRACRAQVDRLQRELNDAKVELAELKESVAE